MCLERANTSIKILKQVVKLKISQPVKSLIYLSILCVVLEGLRLFFKNNIMYRFLYWNLFLAWIPFCLTQLASKFSSRGKAKTLLILTLWLLFFPNSPYIITDLLHLKGYKQNILWFDSLLIFVFAGTGFLLSLTSLQMAHQILTSYFGKIRAWFLVFGVVLLSGFGIYLGRYCRLNSWDLFHQPIWLFKRIVHQFENPLTFRVTLTYAFVIFCIYLIFHDYKKSEVGR